MSEEEREWFTPRQVAAAKLHIKVAKKLGHEPDPRAYVIANAVPVKSKRAVEQSMSGDAKERSEAPQ